MPTLPTYDSPQARRGALPDARVSTDAPLEAFGGGRAVAGASNEAQATLGDISAFQAHRAEKEKTDADAARMSEARRALNEQEYALVYDPKAGALAQQGRNAFGLKNSVPQAFDKFTTEYKKTLATPELRDAWDGMVEARRDHVMKTVLTHVNDQTKVVEIGELQAGTKSSIDRAAVDPSTVPLESSIVDSNVQQLAQKMGWDEKKTAYERAAAASTLHTQVIQRLIATGNDRRAKDYYDEYKDGLIGNDAETVGAAVTHGSYVGDATRETDRIFSPTYKQAEGILGGTGLQVQATPGAQNMDDVRKETSKIKDEKLRQAVEAMARQRLEDMKHAQHQKAMESYEAAAKLVDANPDTKPEFLVPGGQWTQLPAEYRDALNRRAAKEVDDSKVYLQWMDFARNHTATAALPRADFEAQFWSRMTPAHREAAAKEWQSAGEAASKAGDKLTEFKSIWTDREMVLNELKRGQIGGIAEDDTLKTIEEDDTKRKALLDYMDRADQAFLKAKVDSTTKKNPDDLEKQEIVRKMVLREKTVKIQRDWWFDPEKKIKDLSDDEIRKVDSGYEEIPAPSIDNMKRLAKGYGNKLDPENNDQDKLRLSRAYVAAIMGKDALVKSILSGKD